MLVVLGQALEAAARERLVTANVASLVNRPASAPVVVKKTWTTDQVRTFLAHVADDRLAAAWRHHTSVAEKCSDFGGRTSTSRRGRPASDGLKCPRAAASS